MTDKTKQFKQTLDECHEWPCPFIYKFILPTDNFPHFIALFPDEDMTTRESKNGKYTSITMELIMDSSEKVMAIYEKAAKVPGLMAL